MNAPPVLAWLLVAAFAQAQLPAREPPRAPLDDAWVGAHPDRARDSLRIWIAATSAADSAETRVLLTRSESLARTWLRVWGDSFPLKDLRRFIALPPNHRAVRHQADSLRRAGNLALGSRGFDAALVHWRQSARLARSIADTAAFAATIGNIGSGFFRSGEVDSARRYFAAAEDLARRVGDRRTMLNAAGGLASIARDAGHRKAAADKYRATIAIRRQIGDYRGIAADANNLGVLAADLGDEVEAHRRHTEALVTARDHMLDEAAAAALVNLGALATDAGELALAERRYAEALALYRKLGDREFEGLVLYDLGMIDAARGDYADAAAGYADAAAAFDSVNSADRSVAARADLATVLAASGRIEEAERALRLAEAIARRADLDGRVSGRLQLVRGTLALQLNRLRPARAAYGAALTAFRAARDTAGTAQALAALGELSLLEENHAAARAHLSDAAALHESIGDRRSASLARLGASEAAREAGDTAFAGRAIAAAVSDLRAEGDFVAEAWATCQEGEHYRLTGAPGAAEARYRRGLARLGRRPVPAVAACLYSGLASALRMRGATGSAAAELERGIAVVEAAALGMATPARRADYLSDKWALYIDLALAQRAGGDDEAAFATSERLRAREMAEVLAGANRPKPAPREDSRVLALRNRISALLDVGGSPRTAGALRGDDDALRRLSDVRRQALARAYDEYAQLLDSAGTIRGATAPTPSWRDVARRLPPDGAFIEYLVTDSASIAFVITPTRLSAVDLPATGAQLAADADFLRGSLARNADVAVSLRRLHERLVAPIERAGLIPGARSLVIVPHRELHYVPFSALLEAGPRGRHLVERYEITHAASAATALNLASRPDGRGPVRVLALAPRVRALPGAAAEVGAIGRIYGADATVLSGSRATRAAFLEAAPRHSIIHLATLGVLNKHDPRFSFVELAPARDSDGRLEAHDAAALSLRASLVVLSACQTALGSGRLSDVPPGDDWVGLVQAFHTAGAARVVGTLWPVEDRATSVLMSHFYRELRSGRSAQAALTAAQRALLGAARTRSPFYWAGFLISGGVG